MKRNHTNYFFLLMLLAVSFTGCVKDNKSKNEIITSGTWKFAYAGTDANLNWNIESAESTLYDCEKDDIFTFNTDGTAVEAENIVKCGTPTQFNFTWKLSSDEKKFIINLYDTLSVRNIDNSNIELYYESQGSTGLERQITKFVR